MIGDLDNAFAVFCRALHLPDNSGAVALGKPIRLSSGRPPAGTGAICAVSGKGARFLLGCGRFASAGKLVGLLLY